MATYTIERHIRFRGIIENAWRCYGFRSRAEAEDYASTIGIMALLGRIPSGPYTPGNALKLYPIGRFRQDISHNMSLD